MTDEIYDVIIIGGGPAGLSAAQYASRVNLKTIVLDKSLAAGALAYSQKIENYPGLIEPLSGRELLEIFRDQAVKFGAKYIEAQVIGVKLESEVKEVYGSDRTYQGRTVIIATGSMARKPGISGEQEFLGKGVSYCAICDAAFFRDLTVCVLGSTEEALKEAGLLAKFAKKVYVFTHSKDVNVPADHPLLASEKVSLKKNKRVTAIEGDDIVTKVTVRDMSTGEEHEMPMDGVFVYLQGSQPVVDYLSASIELSQTACVLTHRTMETSIPGVFAAGDVTCSEVRQVVVAASFGCIAALSAEKYLHQRKRTKFDWGTS